MGYVEQTSESEFWNPKKEGEELEGTIVRAFDGDHGKQYTIENDKGSFTTCSHTILVGKMSKAKVGDKVKLVFVNEDLPKIKGQNGVKHYNVFIDQAEEESIK